MLTCNVTLDSELQEKVRNQMAIIYIELGDVNITLKPYKPLKNKANTELMA